MPAAMATERSAIAVLGATGFTGRLVAHALRERRAPLLLAGRSRSRLEALARALGGADFAVARVEDSASLDALARRARVLINCAGPFVDLGEPVVRAAIGAGAHYADTTGEQPFVHDVFAHDSWAREGRVAVIPALAFEIALADCAAALAARGLDEVETVEVAYAVRFHASQGTKRSALRMLERRGLGYGDGRWVEEAPGHHSAVVELPLGRRAAVSFPGAEVVTIPRHIAARTVRALMCVPRGVATVAHVLGPALPALARSPLGALARRWLGSGTAGPDLATRRRDTFVIAVDVRGRRAGSAAARRVMVTGCDPYALTAAIAAQGAIWLAGGEHRCSGVLSPAMAFDPARLLDATTSNSVVYTESDM
ncbi:MAG: trans-acting enoyl reductase family protein [Candidatus Binatia bacterium]